MSDLGFSLTIPVAPNPFRTRAIVCAVVSALALAVMGVALTILLTPIIALPAIIVPILIAGAAVAGTIFLVTLCASIILFKKANYADSVVADGAEEASFDVAMARTYLAFKTAKIKNPDNIDVEALYNFWLNNLSSFGESKIDRKSFLDDFHDLCDGTKPTDGLASMYGRYAKYGLKQPE